MTVEQNKKLAAAIKRLEIKQKVNCFDAYDLDSRPIAIQQQVLDDLNTINCRYVVAGNQCLAEGTKVLTTKGSIAIEDIKAGDFVYDENGKEIEVLENLYNGKKEVRSITNRSIVLAKATDDHIFLTRHNADRAKKEKEFRVSEFQGGTQIKRIEIEAPLGDVNEPHAYAIGAFLGDGCSRISGKVISGADPEIIYHVADILGCQDVTEPKSNYSWRLKGNPHCNHYDEWCKGLYAHQKYVDKETALSWDRESLLNFIAGVIDTDGSIYVDSWDTLVIRVEMQAKTVIQCLNYAFLSLWQVDCPIAECDREKFKNGSSWTVKCANNAYTKRMLKELSPYLQCPRKQWKPEYSDLVATRTNPDWIGAKISKETELVDTYDLLVDSDKSLYCLANGLVTHNSGKSQIGSREAAWLFEGRHPNFDAKAKWGDRPLTMMILGRTTKMLQNEIWERKIKPFLVPGSFKTAVSGNTLQSVTHKKTGNTIIFISHNNTNEARQNAQGYVAQWVWLDEMPDSVALFNELVTRVIATEGKFLATFTPLIRNFEIKDMVEGTKEPVAKKYQFRLLDNPKYKGREDEVLELYGTMADSERNARLNGDWYIGDNAVYSFDTERHVAAPPGYSPSWRHIEAIDPAASGKAGYCILAEEPYTDIWYLIRADYFNGDSATKLLEVIKPLGGKCNIVARVCDPHEVWFIKEAASQKLNYLGVWKKNERKKELIKNLQESMDFGRVKIAPWCDDLIQEFISCQWSESQKDKIVGATRFHLLDSVQYALDNLPKPLKEPLPTTFQGIMKKAHRDRKAKEHKKVKRAKAGKVKRHPRIWRQC